MSETIDVSFDLPRAEADAAQLILSENDVPFFVLGRKGLDGHADTVMIVITAAVATVKFAARLMEQKIKKDANTSVSFDGITIKGISEKGVADVIAAVGEARKHR